MPAKVDRYSEIVQTGIELYLSLFCLALVVCYLDGIL